MKRNLLFYIYPIRNSCWSWHFDKLKQYQAAFNGKRVVVIATDANSVSAKEVRDRAAFLDPQFVEVANEPKFCEVEPFHVNLAHFESLNRDEVLFYAHGKGVRHTYFLENVLAWADCMYGMNLGCPELIEKIAQNHSAIGAFRGGPHGGGAWHFSGTFFWLRHDVLFSGPWKNGYADRYGVEGFPGRFIPRDQSFCLTPEIDHGNLYQRRLPRQDWDGWFRDLKEKFGL